MSYLPFYFSNHAIFLVSFIMLIASLSAYHDLKTRLIPNPLIYAGIIGLCIFFIAQTCIDPTLDHWFLFAKLSMLIISLLVFGTLFAKRWIGGGDTKLLIFMSLAFPLENLLSVFLWIFLMGGIYSLFSLVILKSKIIPYAMPILLGVSGYLIHSYFFDLL